MKGILSESTVAFLKNTKNLFKLAAIWTLIGGIALGGIFILVADDINTSDIIGKIMGTFLVMGLAMLVSTIAVHRIDSERASVQVLALTCLILNLLWFGLWTACVWCGIDSRMGNGNALRMAATITSSLYFFTLIGACTLDMYEGDKKNIISPLKITSVACLGASCLTGIISDIIIEVNWNNIITKSNTLTRLGALSGFAGFCWILTLIITAVNSSSEKAKVQKAEKQARIQQKVAEQQAAMMEQAKAAAKAELGKEQAEKK